MGTFLKRDRASVVSCSCLYIDTKVCVCGGVCVSWYLSLSRPRREFVQGIVLRTDEDCLEGGRDSLLPRWDDDCID